MLRFIIFIIIFFSLTLDAQAWGFWAHKRINRLAVYTLPIDMIVFYKNHIEWVTEHAVDPDKRRYATKDEASRHYIDMDRYCHLPCRELPQYYDDAVSKYSEDTLKAHGTVPWTINFMMYKLTDAFRNRNPALILKYSAELGHYIGDAHVPLHTTKNYNGQLTNQKGIHGFWESRLPELFGEQYDYFVGPALYIEKPLSTIWNVVYASHAAVDSVLIFEQQLNAIYGDDRKYTFEERLNQMIKTYSIEYAMAFQRRLDNQIERRMRSAILTIGSYWYTAWVNAGQPDINSLVEVVWSEEDLKEFQELESNFKNGKIYGQEHDN